MLSVGVHHYYYQMNKTGKSKKADQPIFDSKVELDSEGFQVVELK